MPQERCTVAGTKIDQLAAIEIPNVAALGPLKEHGVAERLVDARGRGYAAGQELPGVLVFLLDEAHPIRCPRHSIPE